MNIAIVLMEYNPFGGYERQAAMLAEALVERGDRVTIVANNWSDRGLHKIAVKRIPMIKLSSWLKVLSFAILSKSYLEKNRDRFDMIIAFDRTLVMDIYRAGNACHKEWLNFRKKVGSVWDHISTSINPMHAVINGIEKRIFSRQPSGAKRIVVLSEKSMDHIKRYYSVENDRFVVIPPAMAMNRLETTDHDETRASNRKRIGIEKDALVLLHVGSGFRIKGLKSTIAAMPTVLRKRPNTRLVVVGADRGGIIKHKRLAKNLGVGSYVYFVGGVKNVGQFYSMADVFIVPSLFETFGVATVEALAWGLPVIVGTGAGVCSLVESDVVGRVVDFSMPAYELAKIILKVAVQDELLKGNGNMDHAKKLRMAVASRCERYSVMEKYFSMIDEVMSQKAACAART